MNNTGIIAVYPGTFDPITLGHIDIIERSSKLFSKVIVTIAINASKKPLFSIDERQEMISDAIQNIPNTSVETFDGLVVDFAKARQASVIIRGLRAVSDFEYEFQMALMNRNLSHEISTVFLMPHEKYTYLNSSIIRNVANFGGNVDKFVTRFVARRLNEKLQEEGVKI